MTIMLPSFSQVKNRIHTRTGIVDQFKDYGRVSYQALDYYLTGKDSLLVKGNIFDRDSVIIPEILTVDGKPYNVVGFKQSAFEYNTDIKYVSMPVSVSKVASSAFFHCSRLTDCVMPNVKSIEGSAFAGTWIEKLVLPKSLEYIGYGAFCQCNKLEYVELPENLKYIDDHAFLDCRNLKTVKVNFSKPIKVGSSVFIYYMPNSSYRKITLMVPAGSKQAFEEADCWKRFNPIVEY